MTRTLFGDITNAVRKTASATPPISYARTGNHWFSRDEDGSGDAVQNMAAMTSVGTLFSIVNLTSTATAKPAWHLYRKSVSGRKEDRVEVTSHAALDLWNKPNDFYNRQEFVETEQQHVDLAGECFWVMETAALAGGIPISMWPVRPDRMTPVPSTTSFLAGWIYTSPDGEKVPLLTSQVIQIKMPNPLNPYRGLGPVQSILMEAMGIKYSAAWNQNFFLNGAEPGGIIEFPDGISDPEWDRFTKRWVESHRGVTNAHRVAVIEKGNWVDRKYSHTDMGFSELRKVNDEAIRTAYSIHGHMLGLSEDVNRANADAAENTFAKQQTTVRLERWKSALNGRFLPLFYKGRDPDVEFDYDSPVMEDIDSVNDGYVKRAHAASFLVLAGYDPTEVASAVGLPEMTWVGIPKGAAPAPSNAPQDAGVAA